MARPAPADEGSPARLIATMVGIVGILLLGSLAWSAVGALFSAAGEAASAVTGSGPTPTRLLGPVGTPSPRPTGGTPASVVSTQAAADTPAPGATAPSVDVVKALTPTAETAQSATPTPETPTELTPTPSASGRSPWVLLPQPAPGARVPSGPQVIEARARGDTSITAIKLELDGAALGVSLEQRSESTWRGSSTARVGAGHHSVRATVIDDQGRTGSFRWSFDAGP